MSEAYAGIEVPQGDPGGLEGAAGSFGTLASELSGAGAQLRGMPGQLTTWAGPASVSYAGTCLTNGGACDAGVHAFSHAERALSHYATKLRDAQKRAKAAIQAAREAQHRIDQAQRDITAAQDRMSAAANAEAAMAKQASLAHATGLLAHAFEAARSQAQADGAAAAGDLARAQRALADAQDDLKRAQKRGHDAMDDARDAGNAAASAFAAATGHSPAVAALGPSAGPYYGGASSPMDAWDGAHFKAALEPWDPSNDQFSRGKWLFDQTAAFLTGYYGEKFKDAGAELRESAVYEQEFLRVRPLGRVFAVGPDGEVVSVRALAVSRETATVVDADGMAEAARLTRWGKVGMPVTGGLLAGASAGIDQWREDADNPNLTTTDRVGRSVGVGVYVGGATATGALIGTAIFPGPGTAAGAAAGAVTGLVVGAAASSFTPAKHAAAAVGQWTANAATDTAKSVAHAVTHPKQLLDDINPF